MGGGKPLSIDLSLELAKSCWDIVVVKVFKDFGYVGFNIFYVGGPENSVMMGKNGLKLSVEDFPV